MWKNSFPNIQSSRTLQLLWILITSFLFYTLTQFQPWNSYFLKCYKQSYKSMKPNLYSGFKNQQKPMIGTDFFFFFSSGWSEYFCSFKIYFYPEVYKYKMLNWKFHMNINDREKKKFFMLNELIYFAISYWCSKIQSFYRYGI